jgi:hypothetical protein
MAIPLSISDIPVERIGDELGKRIYGIARFAVNTVLEMAISSRLRHRPPICVHDVPTHDASKRRPVVRQHIFDFHLSPL